MNFSTLFSGGPRRQDGRSGISFWSCGLVLVIALFDLRLLSLRDMTSWVPRLPWLTNLRYPELDTSTDSIRLLVLQPGAAWQTIRCEIYSTTFSDLPSYSALSYAWGQLKETRSIKINGAEADIRVNLWAALHHLRHPIHPRKIWVDAICIDQSNEKEMNHQVPLMTFIYGRANNVLVWLGEQNDIENSVDMKSLALTSSLQLDPEDLSWLEQPKWKSAESSIGQLVREEYWKRAWIIQEVGAATHITVHFGRQSLDWDEFLDLVRLFKRIKIKDPSAEYVLKLSRLRDSRYLEGDTYGLSDLLSTFRNCFSSVGHDKIYAFLGLANDYSTDGVGAIPVNYRASLFDLYKSVIQFQAHSLIDATEKRTEMVFMSGLIRRLLSRKSGRMRVRRDLIIPNGYTKSLEVWSKWFDVTAQAFIEDNNRKEVEYQECMGYRDKLEEEGRSCEKPKNWVADFLLLHMISYPVIHCWLAVDNWIRILTMRFRSKHRYTMFWHRTEPEVKEMWLPALPDPAEKNITIRGYIRGEIFHIGPFSDEILASFNAKKRWIAGLPQYFSETADLRKIRSQNSRLMNIIEDPSGSRLRHIVDFNGQREVEKRPSPRLFLGTGLMAGVVPPSAMIGDIICQFWNSSASAVLREDKQGRYRVVGRAGTVQQGDSTDWDVPEDKWMFTGQSQQAIDISVGIVTLTILSFDTVSLPLSD